MPLSNGFKFAGYTIERRLGTGGMGEVYLAQHPRLPRHDAIKVLKKAISANPDYIERFNREADLASNLWHPHIVRIHDRGKYRSQLWISMDFVDGADASRLLEDRYSAGMPARDVVDIVKAVAAALDYAHGRGLLHRDVKPANILIADVDEDERRILLADFGVARHLADASGAGLTETNMTVGTAAYAAPEQLMGEPVDGRTDQYSLAATAYHLLTGQHLFTRTSPTVVISKHLNEAAPLLADSRPDLAVYDAALSRALSKDPADRFATCQDFARALERPEPVTAPVAAANPSQVDTMIAPVAAVPQPTVAGPPPNRSRRRIAGLAAAGVAVVAAIAVTAYFALQPGAPKPPGEPFTLAGTVHLTKASMKTAALPAGFECAGAKDYGDVSPNASITVENEAGTLLAKGALVGSSTDTDGCAMSFRVDDVPTGSAFYRVQIGQEREMSFTKAEAKAGVEFLMGSPDPDPTTSRRPPPTRTVTVTPTPDVEQVSLARLHSISDADRSTVCAELADRWIPQISSKRVGLVADGKTWNNQMILEQHQRMRNIYPNVKLLWSGDWSTYDGRNFWITVVGLWSYNPDDILGWCTRMGFDRDNCIAKVVSTWKPVAGTTRLNP